MLSIYSSHRDGTGCVPWVYKSGLLSTVFKMYFINRFKEKKMAGDNPGEENNLKLKDKKVQGSQ